MNFWKCTIKVRSLDSMSMIESDLWVSVSEIESLAQEPIHQGASSLVLRSGLRYIVVGEPDELIEEIKAVV